MVETDELLLDAAELGDSEALSWALKEFDCARMIEAEIERRALLGATSAKLWATPLAAPRL